MSWFPFGHIRTKNAADWQEKLGGTDEMVKQTGIIGVTEPIYNDMIAYSKNSELMQDEDFRKALGDSFIELAETDEGKEISACSARLAMSGAMTPTTMASALHRSF